MTLIRLKALVLMALMVITAIVSYLWRPTHYLSDQRPKMVLEQLFPRQFGGWTLDNNTPALLVSPDTQALLDKIYNQTLSRTYVDRAGRRIMLSVAYGGDQSEGTRAHRPEVCYPAQGFDVLSSQVGVVRTSDHPIRVRRLVAKLGQRVEPITYWVVVGDRVALSGTEQKLEQMRYTLGGVIPDGMLVRVSSIDDNAEKAYQLQDKFVAEISSAIEAQSRSRVIGLDGGM